MEAKWCRKCQQDLPLAQFSKNHGYSPCNSCRLAQQRDYDLRRPKSQTESAKERRKLRQDVLVGLGGKCACCGESEPKFLTLDHVQNDGAAHRRRLKREGKSSDGAYREVRRLDYPRDRFQLLCWNCNCAKGKYGKCPHEDL